ncbi:MAG: hypothetical protein ACYDHD_00385 [Vulcanimicrobiaceae bacterium]
MKTRYVAVRLKIPDNQAYTALVVLQRLGIALGQVERSEIYEREEEAGGAAELAQRTMRDESVFNPNKHTLAVLEQNVPRTGEVWIEECDTPRAPNRPRYIGWRLFLTDGTPADRATIEAATTRLLCNPAIERAIM